jgi:hypothetical protein
MEFSREANTFVGAIPHPPLTRTSLYVISTVKKTNTTEKPSLKQESKKRFWIYDLKIATLHTDNVCPSLANYMYVYEGSMK